MKPRSLVIVGAGLLLLLAIWLGMSRGRKDQPVGEAPVPPPVAIASAPAPPAAVSQNAVNPPEGTPLRFAPALVAPLPGSSSGATVPVVPPRNRFPANVPRQPMEPQTGEVVGARKQLDQISLMLRDYRTLMGENPVGTNAEIMKAIIGANPRGAKLGPPEGMSLNGFGELVDQWGTPYFFHQMSGTHMEIWSAGPDRKMGTTDDVILK